MKFDEYQEKAGTTALYPNRGKNMVYPTLGLTGEAGEIAEKMKKIIRDKGGELSDEDKELLALELGDVLWYVAALCHELGIDMKTVASMNLEKLASRKNRDKIKGSGDKR